MIAFLRKAERPEALRLRPWRLDRALLAGAGTWAVATYAIGISGASRELTEGFGSLLAAAILLSVGIWMHGKSQAEEWRRYIAEKMQGALSRGSAWFLFGLAFIVVYREVFETILFFAALWTPDNGATILAGALSAVAVLGGIAWAMLRYSRTLPITQFFRYSAILIAILTVVLAGKGVGALQEAGIIASHAGRRRAANVDARPVPDRSKRSARSSPRLSRSCSASARPEKGRAPAARRSKPIAAYSGVTSGLALAYSRREFEERQAMAGVNKVILVGNLGADPEARTSTAAAKWSICESPRRKTGRTATATARNGPNGTMSSSSTRISAGSPRAICRRARKSISKARSRPANGRPDRQ